MSKTKAKKISNDNRDFVKQQRVGQTSFLLNPKYFALVVTGVFYALSIVGALNHESWRDEYQAFLVANHSASLEELMYNMQYEGHPLLWHLLLFVQTRFADSILVTKLFHITVAATTVWLICRYLPLKMWQKVLLCFSYFLFYEFNLVTRTYAVGVMLFTSAVVIYRLRYIIDPVEVKRLGGYVFALSLVLFLLANTSVIGIVMCGCVLALMASDALMLMKQKKFNQSERLRYAIPFASALVGIVACLLFIQPEPDNTFPLNYTNGFDVVSLQTAFSKMFTNLIMLLPSDVQFWNRHAFDAGMLTWLPWAGVFVLLLSLLYFLRNNRLLLFFGVAAGGMLGFVYFTNMIQVRYSGHWFVMVAIAYALSLDYKRSQTFFDVKQIGNWVNVAFVGLINVTLVAGVLSGVTAYAKDIANPFSNIDNAGSFLLEQRLDKLPIVGATDFVISPLTYHIQKPIRLAESKRVGYFIRWNSERTEGQLEFPDVIGEINTVMNEGRDTVLVILDTPLRVMMNGQPVDFTEDNLPGTNIHLKLIHSVSEPCIVEDELFYFYQASRISN